MTQDDYKIIKELLIIIGEIIWLYIIIPLLIIACLVVAHWEDVFPIP